MTINQQAIIDWNDAAVRRNAVLAHVRSAPDRDAHRASAHAAPADGALRRERVAETGVGIHRFASASCCSRLVACPFAHILLSWRTTRLRV